MDRRQNTPRTLRIVIMSEHEILSLRAPKPQPEPQPWSLRSWAFSERRQIIERRILTHDRRGRGPDRRLPDLLPQARVQPHVLDRRVQQTGPRISADVLGRRFAAWWEQCKEMNMSARMIGAGSVLAQMAESIERRGTPAGEGRKP
jgi:hypothetical protein